MSVKVKLNRTVRYDNVLYLPNQVFEIDEKHLKEMKKLGAFVIKEAEQETVDSEIEDEIEDEIEVVETTRSKKRRR